jgi:hypothetical protein
VGSGFNSKRKDIIDMGNYIPSDTEREAGRWAIKNGIKIAPSAASTTEWYLIIDVNGKVAKSPVTYKKMEIWQQLYKFYLYYYNKHHKIEVEIKDIKKPEVEKEIKLEPKQQQKSLF